MDVSPATVWWVVAGAAVAVELATGTFYLLMVGLGCAAGALAAQAGLGATAQTVAAALVGAGATAAWHLLRRQSPVAAPAASNRDVNLDIGQRLHVARWSHDGSARAPHRGANWAVRYVGSGTPQAGEHVIVAMHGSELHVEPAPAPATAT